MNNRGRVQAEEVGHALARLVADSAGLDYVASPLGRTVETMEVARRALGLDPVGYRLDPRLVELTFGRWEGLTWREVRRSDAALASQRERDKWNFVPPDGESYAMLRERIRPVVAEIVRPTVLVSHGGVARVLLNLLVGMAEHEAPRADIWQGRVLVIEGGRHRWS